MVDGPVQTPSSNAAPSLTPGPPPFASLRVSFTREHFSPYLDPNAIIDFLDEAANRYSGVIVAALVLHVLMLFSLTRSFVVPEFIEEPEPIRVELITLDPQPEPPVEEEVIIPVAPPPPPPTPAPRPTPQPVTPPPPPEPEPEPVEIAPPPPPPEILINEQTPDEFVVPEPIPEPLPEPVPEPIIEPLPEPVFEPLPEPIPEPTIEFYEPIPEPEPVIDPLPPEPVFEPIPEPEPLPPLPEPEPEPLPLPVPEPVIEPAPEPTPVFTPDRVPVPEEPVELPPAPVITETPEPAEPDEPAIITTAPTILASPDAPTTREEADRAIPESQAAPLSDLITGRNRINEGSRPLTGLPGRDPSIAGPSSGGGNITGGTRRSAPGAGGWTLTPPPSAGGGYDSMLLDIRCREAERTHEDCPEYLRTQGGRDASGFETYSQPRHGGRAGGLPAGVRASPGRNISGDIGSRGDGIWRSGGGQIGSNSVNGGGPSTTVLDDTDFSKEFRSQPVLQYQPQGAVRDLFKEPEEEEDDWALELILDNEDE